MSSPDSYSGHDTRGTNAVEREGRQGEQRPIASAACQNQDRASGSQARAAGRSTVYDLVSGCLCFSSHDCSRGDLAPQLNPADIDEESALSSIASQSSESTQTAPGSSTSRYQHDVSPQSALIQHQNPSRNASPGSSQQVHLALQDTLPHEPESALTTSVVDINTRWRRYLEGTSTQARCVYPVANEDTGQEVPCGYTGRTHATKRHIETTHLKIK
jgi:hypothetical protein